MWGVRQESTVDEEANVKKKSLHRVRGVVVAVAVAVVAVVG